MSKISDRKEPVLSDSKHQQRHEQDDLLDSRLPPKNDLDPRLRLAAIAVTFVCALFIVDWGWRQYQEYRAIQMLKQMAEGFEQSARAATRELNESMQRNTARVQAANERRRREAEQRRQALRQERAETNQGKWLGKNCSDWRRAYEDLGAPTAEREMKRQCEIYEKFLLTGIGPPIR